MLQPHEYATNWLCYTSPHFTSCYIFVSRIILNGVWFWEDNVPFISLIFRSNVEVGISTLFISGYCPFSLNIKSEPPPSVYLLHIRGYIWLHAKFLFVILSSPRSRGGPKPRGSAHSPLDPKPHKVHTNISQIATHRVHFVHIESNKQCILWVLAGIIVAYI